MYKTVMTVLLCVCPVAVGNDRIIVSADAGGLPHVRLIDGSMIHQTDLNGQIANSALLQDFFAYDPAFNGGVRVGSADVNGDGIGDLITGSGPGGGPHVKVFDGNTGAPLEDFFAYSPTFTGGVFVAGARNHGNGNSGPRVVLGQGPGGPFVDVFTPDGVPVGGIAPFGPTFSGGIRVAVGDINGDGVDDIITGTGPGSVGTVCTFNGVNGQFIDFFNPFGSSFTGGVFVAAGDVNGDSIDDIIMGADAGGLPHVRIFDGTASNTDAPLADFFAFAPTFTGGVRVATGDVNGDGIDDIITGAGPGGGPHVKVFDGTQLTASVPGELASFFAFDPSFTGGVFVSGALIPEPTAGMLLALSTGWLAMRRRHAR